MNKLTRADRMAVRAYQRRHGFYRPLWKRLIVPVVCLIVVALAPWLFAWAWNGPVVALFGAPHVNLIGAVKLLLASGMLCSAGVTLAYYWRRLVLENR